MKTLDAALNRAAEKITTVVGTMWCAIAFSLLTLFSLPATLATGDPVAIVQWIAQTFLQLVLLSVIMVGQRLASLRAEALIQETHDVVIQELAIIRGGVIEVVSDARAAAPAV